METQKPVYKGCSQMNSFKQAGMWQSQVEIEHYSVRLHYCIQSAVKGGAHMCCVSVVSIHELIY